MSALGDEGVYFPKTVYAELEAFADKWSRHLWRIQEAGRKFGVSDDNFERMDMQRCLIVGLAIKLSNATFDEAGKPTCPERCLKTERRLGKVFVPIEE